MAEAGKTAMQKQRENGLVGPAAVITTPKSLQTNTTHILTGAMSMHRVVLLHDFFQGMIWGLGLPSSCDPYWSPYFDASGQRRVESVVVSFGASPGSST